MKQRIGKGIVAAMIGTTMAFSMLPAAAIAEELAGDDVAAANEQGQNLTDAQDDEQATTQNDTQSDDVSGQDDAADSQDAADDANKSKDVVINGITFEAWDATDSLPPVAGNYYLVNDVSLGSSGWSAPEGKTNLNLNGKAITIVGASDAISVPKGATLGVYDGLGTGKMQLTGAEGGSVVTVKAAGAFDLYGGTITGPVGVTVDKKVTDESNSLMGGTFNMLGGVITGCTMNGVRVLEGASFTMSAGSVKENSSTSNGAGVYVHGGTATIGDGDISGNKGSAMGGGVYVASGTLNLHGGLITGNTAGKAGAGVYVAADDALVNVSGAPKAVDNKVVVGEVEHINNVHLAKGAKILGVDGKLTDGAMIGVTVVDEEAEVVTGAFTTGYTKNGNEADPSTYFTSDVAGFAVVSIGDPAEAGLEKGYNVTVSTEIENGTVSVDKTVAPKGYTVTITAQADEGYRLESLSVTDAAGEAVEVDTETNTFVMPESDVTVSATFTNSDTCIITFEANGGTGEMDKQIAPKAPADLPENDKEKYQVTLNKNQFTRSGYTFDGWNTEKDGTGTTIRDQATVILRKDTTLYAQWKKNSSSSSSSGTSSKSSSLAKTADPTSLVAVATMAITGAAAAVAGIRKKNQR